MELDADVNKDIISFKVHVKHAHLAQFMMALDVVLAFQQATVKILIQYGMDFLVSAFQVIGHLQMVNVLTVQ
jgi:hypothetical protein